MKGSNCKALDHDTPLGQLLEQLEQVKSRIRAKVEHPYRVIKRQFGYVKVRYRGLMKNAQQLHTLFALSNLWTVQRLLLQESLGSSWHECAQKPGEGPEKGFKRLSVDTDLRL